MSDDTNPRTINGVIVLLLLLVNISGNSLVVYIYQCRIKRSVFSFFVTVLAALDLTTAVTSQTMDVMIKIRPLSETALDLMSMCKLCYFLAYGTSMIGACVLVLIAHQRYRKICHPLKPSMTYRQAQMYVAAITITCMVLSIPTLVINGTHTLKVLVDDGSPPVNTTSCRYDSRYEGTLLQKVFSSVLLLSFASAVISNITFYALIYRTLRGFERKSSVYNSQPPESSSTASPSGEVGTGESSVDALESGEERNEDSKTISWDVAENENQSQAKSHDPRHRKSQEEQHKAAGQKFRERSYSSMSISGGRSERMSSQMYLVFYVVNTVFIVSYLPHLVVLILNIVLHLEYRELTWMQRFFIDLAYISPYISTVANPFVYGFWNAEFRRNCKQVLTCAGSKQKRGSQGK